MVGFGGGGGGFGRLQFLAVEGKAAEVGVVADAVADAEGLVDADEEVFALPGGKEEGEAEGEVDGGGADCEAEQIAGALREGDEGGEDGDEEDGGGEELEEGGGDEGGRPPEEYGRVGLVFDGHGDLSLC